jgi:hypothetical protein
MSYAEFVEIYLRRSYDPLAVDGPMVTVDTTDWTGVDYRALCRALRSTAK